MLLHGSEPSIASQLSDLKKYPGLGKVYTATHAELENPYVKSVALVAKNIIEAGGYDKVIAATSSFGKDTIPRIGGLMDLQAITDVVEIKDGGAKFVRPIYAGNALCTVSSIDKIKLLTVRSTNFEKVKPGSETDYPVEKVECDEILAKLKSKWVENIVSKSEMADLTSAKYVVSGGRALKSGENFQMLYDIADTLGKADCAIGASRAAVDAGYVGNDLQVGQTGKVVAPDIYFAIGISGAI